MIWCMNSKWVIAYDLNVKGMKADRYTKSQVVLYYNSVKKCLHDNGFDRFTQGSIYGTNDDENVLTRVYKAIDALRAIKDAHFVNRLHLFKAESLSDLRPLLPTEAKSDEKDPIEEKIDDAFEGEES